MLKQFFIYALLVFSHFTEPFHLQKFKNKALLMCRSVRHMSMICESLPRDENEYEACNEHKHCPRGKFCLNNVCEKGVPVRRLNRTTSPTGDLSQPVYRPWEYTPRDSRNPFQRNIFLRSSSEVDQVESRLTEKTTEEPPQV